jgi:hypothetical protein
MEDVGRFYGHLVHFTVFCYILCTFGIVCGDLVYFSFFGILYQDKSGNTGVRERMFFPKSIFLMAQKSKNLSSHDLCIITLSTEKR